jgi:hypothetical protein
VVTQLGECKTEDLEVAGSSPARGTILSSMSDSLVARQAEFVKGYFKSAGCFWKQSERRQ